MRWIQILLLRLRALVFRGRAEQELAEELRHHTEEQTAANIRAGMSATEARRTALVGFGGVEQIKEECRDARGVNWVENFFRDVHFGLRMLRKSPGFTLAAILTLALGIGANTAIFSAVNAIVFRPLPYPQPSRLFGVETRIATQPELDPATSGQDFFDLRERTRSFSSMAGISPIWSTVVTGRGDAERLETLFVSAELFPMLGVKFAAGRGFLPEEDSRKAPAKIVVLSYSYWQRKFGGDTSAVGQNLDIDGEPHTIIAVLPAGFHFLGGLLGASNGETDLWLPLASNPILSVGRSVRFLTVVGRLAPGVTMQQADAEIKSVWAGLVNQFPDTNRGFQVRLAPLEKEAIGAARPALLLLLGMVGFVLLIACANVGNLLLARTAARQKEIAVRKALGATSGRLQMQLLTESLVLSCIGGALGLVCAFWGLRALVALGPASLPRRGEISIDLSTLVFTLVASALTGVICGVAPALEIASRDLHATLKEGGRISAGGSHRLRAALIIAEVALATVLLSGAGLLAHSFARLLQVNPGFVTKNVVTLSTQTPPAYSSPESRVALYLEIALRLRSVPGVLHVGAVSRLPLLGGNLGSWVLIEGRVFPDGQHPDVEYRIATPSYFATLGIPLLRGRLFDERDATHPQGVVLINEAMAARFWPDDDPLGKRIKLGMNPEQSPWITIVGVVGNVRHVGLDVAPRAEVYRPYAHNPMYAPIFVVRTESDAKILLPSLRAAFRGARADLPLYNTFEMTDLIDRSTAQRRFPMLLLSGFAALALLLAAVGIYGVISQSVAQRTQEIGVRLAIGASARDIIGMILQQGLRLAAAGIAIGLAAGLALSRLMVSLLFGVSAHDPAVFTLVPLVLAAAAALACLVPAYRASRVDPLIALHDE